MYSLLWQLAAIDAVRGVLSFLGKSRYKIQANAKILYRRNA